MNKVSESLVFNHKLQLILYFSLQLLNLFIFFWPEPCLSGASFKLIFRPGAKVNCWEYLMRLTLELGATIIAKSVLDESFKQHTISIARMIHLILNLGGSRKVVLNFET